MKTRVRALAIAALAMIGLAGCSPTSSPPAAEETSAEAAPGETTPAEGEAVLMVASTDLGDVIVDAKGLTVYMFDKDTQGGDTSACTGQCLEMWPPVITGSDAPTATDVTGELGTIETPDGKLQVTVNGWPVYYWYQDAAPGDVNGQAVGSVWWVLDPAGEPVRDEATGSSGY